MKIKYLYSHGFDNWSDIIAAISANRHSVNFRLVFFDSQALPCELGATLIFVQTAEAVVVDPLRYDFLDEVELGGELVGFDDSLSDTATFEKQGLDTVGEDFTIRDMLRE